MRLIVLSLLLSISSVGRTQQISVKGGFLEDSVAIGEEIHFWLSAKYPPDLQLVLPDTNYNFAPYEFVEKTYLPSELIGQQAEDSAVYTLQSFEIDPIQYLQLSAIILADGDSLALACEMDSIIFKELAPVVTDTTRLKTNIEFQAVGRQFNYPLLWIILVALFVLVSVFVLVFGGKIRKSWKIKKLKKEYQTFSNIISEHIRKLKENPQPALAETALTHWKTYLEKLEKVPYTKYTSSEILEQQRNAELRDTLRQIDKTVYGKIPQNDIFERFQDIEDFTQHRYSMTLDELKNGK